MSEPELSVVVPFYNEERTLAALVDRVLDLPLTLEIVLVDDASRDSSPLIAADLAKRHAQVQVLTHPANRGKGAAVRTGVSAARGQVVVIQDADLEYNPRDLVRMLDEMRRLGTPVIYGSRRLYTRSQTARPLYYWGGVLLTAITNLLYGCHLTDEPTCYKMWRRELIQSVPLKADGFEFCPEVTARVLKLGIPIPEIQVEYHPRTVEEGKKIRLRDGWIAIWTLLRLRWFD